MPYCEKCLTEYVVGTQQCEDCRVALVAGSPPKREGAEPSDISEVGTTGAIRVWLRSLVGAGQADDTPPVKIVRIRVFSGPTALLDADLARNLLRASGIPSMLPGESSVEMLPFLDVPLLVREDDAEQAAGILRNYFDRTDSKPVK